MGNWAILVYLLPESGKSRSLIVMVLDKDALAL